MASTSDSTKYWGVVTPSDTVNIRNGDFCNYLYVGVTGNITAMVVNPGTGALTATLFSNLAVGYHPIETSRINNTGTTATNILAAF